MFYNVRQLASVFLVFNYEVHNTPSCQILPKSHNSRLSYQSVKHFEHIQPCHAPVPLRLQPLQVHSFT